MTWITSLIAWRYLWHKEKDSNISIMIKICFSGIMIGTFALMLTLIITNGFEKVIHEKMRGINAQLMIKSPEGKLDDISIQKALVKKFKNDITGISSISIKQAILDHNDHQTVLFLKGINPDTESSVTTLATKIISDDQNIPPSHASTSHNLATLLKDNNIIIGYKTAQEHGLRSGDHVKILIPEPRNNKSLALNPHKVHVAAIFKIGLEEYDSNMAFISHTTLNKLYDEHGADYITLKLAYDNDRQEQAFKKLLQERLPHLIITSWKDLYPALVASLKLEKYVMFFVLALISLVACMNMLSLLFMQIQHKRRDIAIFKAMGLSDGNIRSIFLQMGLAITLLASLSGLTLAAGAGYILERYPFIQLPDVYYISYLPARMDLEIFIIVFVATLILGFLATWIPARQSAHIAIARVLRQE